MVSIPLILSIVGLALLDSLNPATIVAVTLILLVAPKRAGLIALGAVTGAAITVFAVGATIFLTAGAGAVAVDGITVGLRFLAFGAAGIAIIVAGVKRFRDRERKPIFLPTWFTPAMALPFGVLLTAADLPNAFPFFIAIERMVSADVGVANGLLVLAGYAIIYCLPCLILLLVGTINRDRTRSWLQQIVTKFGSGTISRSFAIGVISIAIGIAVASVPFLLV